MKCVICGMEAEYVQSGMSLCEKHFKAQQVGDREIDFLKIQIQADKRHTQFTSSASFVFAIFGLVAVFITLYYQGLVTSNFIFLLAGLVGIGGIYGVTFVSLYLNRKSYSKDLKTISDMIEAVDKGKRLPSLEKLDEWKKEEGERID